MLGYGVWCSGVSVQGGRVDGRMVPYRIGLTGVWCVGVSGSNGKGVVSRVQGPGFRVWGLGCSDTLSSRFKV